MDGQRHGYGRMRFTDKPAVYEGHWNLGKRWGNGTLYLNADRTLFYTGKCTIPFDVVAVM